MTHGSGRLPSSPGEREASLRLLVGLVAHEQTSPTEFLRSLQRATGAHCLCLLLHDSDLGFFAGIRLHDDGKIQRVDRTVARRDGVSNRIMASRQPSVVPDVKVLIEPLSPQLPACIGAFVGLPLGQHGVMYTNYHEPRAFSPDDLDYLVGICDVVSLALDRFQLSDKVRDQSAEMDIVAEIAELATAEGELTMRLAKISERLAGLAEADVIIIQLADHANNVLRVAAVWADDHIIRDTLDGVEVGIKDGVVPAIVDHRQPIIVDDIPNSALSRTMKGMAQRFGARSVIIMPLYAQGDLVGLLDVVSLTERSFRPSDIRRYRVLGDQLASAIQSARLYEETRRLARIDGLTGLINRQQFDVLYERERQRIGRHGGVFSVMMIDLDGFKAVNDDCGHAAGDTMLRTAAQLVGRAVRESDLAARYGGDEFVVLLTGTDAQGAGELQRRIERGIQSVNQLGLLPCTLRMSIGIADSTCPDPLLEADKAMYANKREARSSLGHIATRD